MNYVLGGLLALAPADLRVIAATGGFYGATGRWVEAEEQYARAFDLGLERAEAPDFATFQMTVGHFQQAREIWEDALEVDPFNGTAASFLMMAYDKLGEDELRRQTDERGQARYAQWPDPLDAILIALAEDDLNALRVPGRAPMLGIVGPFLDDPGVALERLRELDSGPDRPAPLILFVRSALAAYLGDAALGLDLLREFFSLGMVGNLQRTWYPAFDSVRAEPGFETLLEQLGLPDYWDKYGWPTQCARFDDGSFDCA